MGLPDLTKPPTSLRLKARPAWNMIKEITSPKPRENLGYPAVRRSAGTFSLPSRRKAGPLRNSNPNGVKGTAPRATVPVKMSSRASAVQCSFGSGSICAPWRGYRKAMSVSRIDATGHNSSASRDSVPSTTWSTENAGIGSWRSRASAAPPCPGTATP